MNLGDNVKYTDPDSNELLATLCGKTASGKFIISLAGGLTIEVDSSEVDSDLSVN